MLLEKGDRIREVTSTHMLEKGFRTSGGQKLEVNDRCFIRGIDKGMGHTRLDGRRSTGWHFFSLPVNFKRDRSRNYMKYLQLVFMRVQGRSHFRRNVLFEYGNLVLRFLPGDETTDVGWIHIRVVF